jgi:hypothetical protein
MIISSVVPFTIKCRGASKIAFSIHGFISLHAYSIPWGKSREAMSLAASEAKI